MLHRVALVRTAVSMELSAAFIRVTRIGELGTTLAVTSNRRMLRRNTTPFCILNSEFHTSFLSHLVFFRSMRRLLVTASVVPSSPILVSLMKEALISSETSVLTRAKWHKIPEDAIFIKKHAPVLRDQIVLLPSTNSLFLKKHNSLPKFYYEHRLQVSCFLQ
jgi:hypothetical protein